MRIFASFLCIRSQIFKPTEFNIKNLQLHQYLKTFYCREILIMLSVFDTIFVVTATISFSLPILSHSWNVNIWLGLCFDRNIWQIFPDILICEIMHILLKYYCIYYTFKTSTFPKLKRLNFQTAVHPFLFPWLSPILQISLNGSIWATVSVAIERFISIVHPRFW